VPHDHFRLCLFYCLVIALLASCVQKRDLNQNILVVHFLAEPRGLHPINDNSIYQKIIFQCTQRRLIQVDLEHNIYVPDLLDSLPRLLPDSMSYACRLKSGIRWDDGSPLSAKDVLFTLKMIKCPLVNNPEGKPVFNNLHDIELDHENPLQFTVINSKRYFDNAGMLFQTPILQEAFWDPDGIMKGISLSQLTDEKFSSVKTDGLNDFIASFNHTNNARIPARLVGLGNYKVSDWQTGSSITLVRKATPNEELPVGEDLSNYPEKIVFRIIRDMEPVILGFKREEIDITTELSTAGLVKLQKRDYFNDAYHSEFVGSFTYAYMGMNMKPEGGRKSFFTDSRVRRAIAHLVPVEEIIQVIAKGQAKRHPSFALPDQYEYDPSIPLIEPNLELAKKLLDDAGWKDTDGDQIRDKQIAGQRVSFSFMLSYMLSPVTKEIALMIKNELYKAGIEAKPDPMDFSVFYQKAFAHEFDAMLGSWSSSALPEDARQIWHTESWLSKGGNFVGFGSAYSDSLIELANVTMDPVRRKEIMSLLQREVWEQQPYVFLFNATKKMVIHKRFEHRGMYPEKPHIYFDRLKLKNNMKTTETPDNK